MLTLSQEAVQASAWVNSTRLDYPSFLVLLLAIIVAVWDVQKYWVPLLASVVFVTPAQRLVLAGQDLSVLRIVVLVGLAACLGARRRCWDPGERLDVVVLSLAVWHIIIGFVRPEIGPLSRVGSSIDTFGSYLLCRSLLRSSRDFVNLGLAASLVAVFAIPFYLFEFATSRSLFSAFGGVPPSAVIRRGIPRCQGAFSHSISSGLFFVLIAVVIFSAKEAASLRARIWMWCGIVASSFIVVASNSSTPISVAIIAVLLVAIRPARGVFGVAAWALLLAAIPIHLLSGRGIHSVLARVDVVGGSTGWHRYNLIDAAITHFGEWAAVGIESTAHWGWYLGDVTNEYLTQGVRSGIVGLGLAAWAMGCAARQSWQASLDSGRVNSSQGYWVFVGVLGLAASMISVSMFSGLAVMHSLLLAMVVALRVNSWNARHGRFASEGSQSLGFGSEDRALRMHEVRV